MPDTGNDTERIFGEDNNMRQDWDNKWRNIFNHSNDDVNEFVIKKVTDGVKPDFEYKSGEKMILGGQEKPDSDEEDDDEEDDDEEDDDEEDDDEEDDDDDYNDELII